MDGVNKRYALCYLQDSLLSKYFVSKLSTEWQNSLKKYDSENETHVGSSIFDVEITEVL